MAQPPDAAWQAKARRIIDEAHDRLWSPEGQRAWGYTVWDAERARISSGLRSLV
ncbi:MAG: hypothetical protein IPK17_38780 [Chloroflexi bacterium]|uniref:hypothetical protein n=1 Tax=Candidatus Flexifilum breve TaxID=3140694 RepID=UPI003135963C|nr:hypothetical protein [Chloroflexota bacterium]